MTPAEIPQPGALRKLLELLPRLPTVGATVDFSSAEPAVRNEVAAAAHAAVLRLCESLGGLGTLLVACASNESEHRLTVGALEGTGRLIKDLSELALACAVLAEECQGSGH
ncbi:hypothetical protein GT347_00520 [Xylophilus rhododendri]|uniref:Uncharacterized protein n=1 Tax=Xylophilus rhododendri TaxID=2697032 RepID=A0A857J0H3_9BURK|nr:hypothetical protein [Xylophilus rhododendri]QHI96611.1 hypothetical protein GT347_00520 [Xylophilus rhododendri]